jgi:hypothetical protein
MRAFDEHEQDDAGVVFRDLLTLALCGFIVCVVLMLPHVNPAQASRTADGASAPGNVLIEATGPPELDTDVDLWVQAPGDVPVGYSNKGGALFNLLRDDLGRKLDVSGLNYESAYSRGILAGEYTVNLHLYRNLSQTLPIPARVIVSVRGDPSAPTHQILTSDVKLTREGQELTVFRFKLAADGQLEANSVNALQKPLRSGVKS